jgi:hypothetical protein
MNKNMIQRNIISVIKILLACCSHYENERLLVSLNEAYGDGLDEGEIDMLSQMRRHQWQLIERNENER